jgi:hypothetical protein
VADDADRRATVAQVVMRLGVMVCPRSQCLCCALAQIHEGPGSGCVDGGSSVRRGLMRGEIDRGWDVGGLDDWASSDPDSFLPAICLPPCSS